ncbi:MAG: beta strand repeat-containing protein [Methylobacter sp.]
MKKSKIAITVAGLLTVGSQAVMADVNITNTLTGVAGQNALEFDYNATNDGSATNTGEIGTPEAQFELNNGFRNSAGISAIGASASVSTNTTAQGVNLNLGAEETVEVGNTFNIGTVSSLNGVIVNDEPVGGSVDNINSSFSGIIDGGVGNSVNISAIGASSSVSANTAAESSVLASVTNNLATSGSVVIEATNNGAVTNGIAPENESAAQLNQIFGGQIVNSNSSSMGLSAIGASGQLSATTNLLNMPSAEGSVEITNNLGISEGNIESTSVPASFQAAEGGGSISWDGEKNVRLVEDSGASVSGTGGDLKITGGQVEILDDSGTVLNTVDLGDSGELSVTNSSFNEGVYLLTNGSTTGGATSITGNVSGFDISGMNFSPATVTYAIQGGATIAVVNNGNVSNYGTIVAIPAVESNPVQNVSITDSFASSMSINAVGASASAASNFSAYSTTDGAPGLVATANTIDVAALSALNSGTVLNVGVIEGGAGITGGYGNSAAVSAVAASASMSNSVSIVGAN